MGDRAYVEIVCREEDEPLFEALGFMQEFRHALPANVVTMVDAEASEGATTEIQAPAERASHSVVGTMPVEVMTELASPVPTESTTRYRG
jgi:hypothetical protein